tara:strand:- start:240 stop:869 length:630 start_codon:yes stop_codon:yes gene_type:complete
MSRKLNKLYGGIDKILSNNYALYIFAFLSFVDIWNNLKNNDIQSLVVFLLSGYITSIFSKNLTVIFIIALVVSNMYKGVTEGFFDDDSGFPPKDDSMEQEHEAEAFATMDAEKQAKQEEKQEEEEEDSDDEGDEANVENYDTQKSGGKVTKEQVKDAKELADVQSQLLNNLKEMTPLIQKVEGFADKYKDNVSNDNIEKLIQAFTTKKK